MKTLLTMKSIPIKLSNLGKQQELFMNPQLKLDVPIARLELADYIRYLDIDVRCCGQESLEE